MKFGKALAAKRKAQGISQLRLASLARTTQRHVSFLETERARPTREMVMRLSEALAIAPARRADLFQAAGFVSPYKKRQFSDAEISATLSLIEERILANWPFGAFALTPTWDILLANEPGAALLGTSRETIKTGQVNFFDVLLSPAFRARVRNWDECAATIYARMRRHAIAHPQFQSRIERALDADILSGTFEPLAGQAEIPAVLPFELVMPDNTIQRITSLTAHFTSVHDEIIAGLDIELLVPLGQDIATP